MATLKIGKSLKDEDVLWRYVSLEVLINILESRTLHFSPLAAYRSTDPFEGYLPKVAMDAMASISVNFANRRNEQIDDMELRFGLDKERSEIAQLRADAAKHSMQIRDVHKSIVSCLMVSCWHRNHHESEAMWGLYSKSGVAIKSTVGSIKAALEGNQQAHVIHMGAIKYIDFADKTLTAPDCVTDDGHLIGMIKRVAYSHEKEVRMCITGDVNKDNATSVKPKPAAVDVDTTKLIEGLVISPFASIPLRNSIYAISRKYDIGEDKISNSPLLDNCEYLLDSYIMSPSDAAT